MDPDRYTTAPIGDGLESYISIACESLLAPSPDVCWRAVKRVGQENIRGVFDGDRLVGGVSFYRAHQWFGGRKIGSGCVSGVAIDPAERGTGACASMLRSLLAEFREEGFPLAALYASTQRLYRSVGFEQAGTRTQYSLPISSIWTRDRSLAVHRVESPSIEVLQGVADTRAKRTNGNVSRTPGLWDRLINPSGGSGTVTYLIGDRDAPQGYAILTSNSRDSGLPAAVTSTDVATNTPEATRRLLTLVRDHRSMCDRFEWVGASNDPLLFFADEHWVKVQDSLRWMLRVVDLPAAIRSRGYQPSANGTLHLDVEDDLLAENAGRWEITFDSGTATVRRGGDGSMRMNVRGLAPLFSGFHSAEQLAQMGVIQASDRSQIQLASTAFLGDPPWLPEIF